MKIGEVESWMLDRVILPLMCVILASIVLGMITYVGYQSWVYSRDCEEGHDEKQTVCVDNRANYCAAYAERMVFVCTKFK